MYDLFTKQYEAFINENSVRIITKFFSWYQNQDNDELTKNKF